MAVPLAILYRLGPVVLLCCAMAAGHGGAAAQVAAAGPAPPGEGQQDMLRRSETPPGPGPAVSLAGLVFLPGAEELELEVAAPPAGGLDLSRVPALATPEMEATLRPYLGLPIGEPLLGSLRSAILRHYGSLGRRFVSVVLPPQDVTSGVVQVIVVEARIGALGLEGDRWFDAGQYLGSFRLRPGDEIDDRVMQADLDWINRNPYRRAGVVAAPGEAVGTTDLTIRTEEQPPYAVTAGVANTGNDATGLERFNAGFSWGNAFWRGDDAAYSYTTSKNRFSLRQHALYYTLYLPWRDSLALSGTIADTRGNTADSLITTTGHTDQLSLRYASALPALSGFTHGLTFGYDFKSTNNDILFSGTGVFPTTTEIDQFLGSYGGRLTDGLGATAFNLALTFSPGRLSSHNDDATFATQQAGATARYVYGRATVDRLTELPAGLSWALKSNLQISDTTLLPSEQMAFGGSQSIRGFIESQATRDNGFQLTTELRAPPVVPGLPGLLGMRGDSDRLTAALFADFGIGWNHTRTTDDYLQMASIGPAISYQFARYGSLRLSYGVPVQLIGATPAMLRPHFSFQLTF